MKNFKVIFSLLAVILCLQACTDKGTVNVNYQEATAIYGDMDAIRAIELNAPAKELNNPGKIFIAENFVLIGEEGDGIHVIDNTNRLNPVHTSFINIPGNREFYVSGSTLYAESYYDMLKIDITNPNDAQLLDRAKEVIQDPFLDSNGKTLLGFSYEEKSVTLSEDDAFYDEIIGDQLVYLDFAQNIIPNSAVPSSFAGNSSSQSGTVNRITEANDNVYVVSSNNMIIIDEDEFHSSHNRIENFKEDMETVFAYGNQLFVGSRSSMSVYNMGQEGSLQEVFDFDHATSCDPVLAHDEVAYVTLRTADFSDCPGNINALVVIDIEDIAGAKQVGEIQMASPYGMSVINELLYVGEGQGGLKVFDLSNKLKPVLVSNLEDVEAYDIIADPSSTGIIFVAGPHGLEQYGVNQDLTLDFKSTVAAF